MRIEYDFSKGKRGAVLSAKGKTRSTDYSDDPILYDFRTRAKRAGTGDQTMMKEALKAFLEKIEQPVTAAILRQIIREEFPEKSRLTRLSNGRAKTARR